MNLLWKQLHQLEDIDEIIRMSALRPQVIFKHSSRCHISSIAKRRLEESDSLQDVDFHFLDLIKYRDLSNRVGQTFEVHHESPQILLIKNGECIYDESHLGIDMDEIGDAIAKI